MNIQPEKNENSRSEYLPYVIGLNHISSSVDLRDKAFFNEEQTHAFLETLKKQSFIQELVIVSTCNRTEIFFLNKSSSDDFQNKAAFYRKELERLWSDFNHISSDLLHNHVYFHAKEDAIRHLFRVISSLDSMVVGENQIQGQIKNAFELAKEHNTVDFFFNHLFQSSFKLGKRVRTETTLNEGAVSISYAAVELAKKVLGKKFSDKTIGIVGSGEMGELTAMHLKRAGAKNFILFNRTLATAQKLAGQFNGKAHTLEEMPGYLDQCDIIVSATGATEIIITKAHIQAACAKRSGNPLFLIDIAAPRDIDPGAAEIADCFLFTIDDLKQVVGDNIAMRHSAVDKANNIIEEEILLFNKWFQELDLKETIQKLRSKFSALLEQEIYKHKTHIPSEAQERFEQFSQSFLNKVLHLQITGLKKMGSENGNQRASEIANVFFDLDNDKNE